MLLLTVNGLQLAAAMHVVKSQDGESQDRSHRRVTVNAAASIDDRDGVTRNRTGSHFKRKNQKNRRPARTVGDRHQFLKPSPTIDDTSCIPFQIYQSQDDRHVCSYCHC